MVVTGMLDTNELAAIYQWVNRMDLGHLLEYYCVFPRSSLAPEELLHRNYQCALKAELRSIEPSLLDLNLVTKRRVNFVLEKCPSRKRFLHSGSYWEGDVKGRMKRDA